MPADSKENLILGSLLALFSAITAGATYLTSPTVELGVPPDPIPAVDAKPRIYVAYLRSDPDETPRTGPFHYWKSQFLAIVCAKDQDTMNKVRKDVLVALYGGEQTLRSAYGGLPYPLEFTRPDGLLRAGVHVGMQTIGIDYETDHSAA